MSLDNILFLLISPHINAISKHIAKENKQKTSINHACIVLTYMHTPNFLEKTLKIPTTEESRYLGTLDLSTLQFYCDSMETPKIWSFRERQLVVWKGGVGGISLAARNNFFALFLEFLHGKNFVLKCFVLLPDNCVGGEESLVKWLKLSRWAQR